MWPATFGLACCAIEMMAAGAADFDLARFGMEVFQARRPRQSDLMIVAGRVSQKMAPVLRQVYDQMVEPKWVISMGVCASTGGMFNNYAIVQGVDEVVPVDVYAPGCPPSPQTLIHSILTLHEKVRTGEITRRRALRAGAGAGVDLAIRGRGMDPAGRFTGPNRDPPIVVDEATGVVEVTTPYSIAAEIPGLSGIPVTFSRKQEVLHPTRAQYVEVIATLRGSGFVTCRDLCGVDYLTPMEARPLPDGVVAERFEIVVVLLSHERRARIRIRVQVPESDPTCPSIFTLYPGTENMEREAYDMFGISFSDHPDLTRILMPEDWEGHPLRKDYGTGRVPVQFKDAPGPR